MLSSVTQSCPTFCDPMDCGTPASLFITNPQSLLKLRSNELVMPSNHLISVVPFFHFHSFPASGSFSMSQFFTSGGQSTGVSASASVFPITSSINFHLDGLVGSPCSPRDSQESSPTPQFKSIDSSVLSFLYSPDLTSILYYWKTIALTNGHLLAK